MFWFTVIATFLGTLAAIFAVGVLGGWLGQGWARKQVRQQKKTLRREQARLAMDRQQLWADKDVLRKERREFKEGLAAEQAKALHMIEVMEDDTIPQYYPFEAA